MLGSEDPTPLDPVPDPRIRRSEDPDPLDPLACLIYGICINVSLRDENAETLFAKL